MPGVVNLPQGAWWTPDADGVDRRGSVNVLTSERWTPFAFGAALQTVMVQVDEGRREPAHGLLLRFVDLLGLQGLPDRLHGPQRPRRPARLWRRVSEVAGGGWQRDGAAWRSDVFAYHLSISCNHCERPICLECCPSGAITQREDGVVLIDEEHCLGCGYCSWACPYGAPQLRSDTGAMSKCTSASRTWTRAAAGLRGRLPGAGAGLCRRLSGNGPFTARFIEPLPDPELTRPALEVEAHRDVERAHGRELDLDPRPPRGLREWSLVCFTLLIQMAAGLAFWLGAARWWPIRAELDGAGLLLVLLLTVAAIGSSLFHLGRPHQFLRAMSNLRSSWLSREILLACLFFFLGLWALFPAGAVARDWLLPVSGLLLIGGMARVYMLRTVPVWDRARTPLTFLFTGLLLGGTLTLALLAPAAWAAFAVALVLAVLHRGRFFASYRRKGV